MDLTSKKVQKNIIKLALCIRKASRNDLLLLGAMLDLRIANMQDDISFPKDMHYLIKEIADNPHICALLGIKDNK